MLSTLLDQLEVDYGTKILSGLIGEPLTRNQQPVRLFDQTKHSSEYFFRCDIQTGKPYVQDFQNSKRYYPVTAYCQKYNIDFSTAVTDLTQQYIGNSNPKVIISRPRLMQPPVPSPSFCLPIGFYERCQTQFERNGFYEYLRYTYGIEEAEAVFRQYRIGTSIHWQYLGYLSTCLPQFNIYGNLKQVKIMPFDAMNGRRVKKNQLAEQWNYLTCRFEPTVPGVNKIYFAGKLIAKKSGNIGVNLSQCFFGEHLLMDYPDKEVAIVEGESTAIICSLYWPQYVWLATGGRNGAKWVNSATFIVLSGRNVVLWPDNDCYEDWCTKANSLRPLVRSLRVSDYVKKNAPRGHIKADLRDLLVNPYLIKQGGIKIHGESLTTEQNYNYPSDWN